MDNQISAIALDTGSGFRTVERERGIVKASVTQDLNDRFGYIDFLPAATPDRRQFQVSIQSFLFVDLDFFHLAVRLGGVFLLI